MVSGVEMADALCRMVSSIIGDYNLWFEQN